MKTSSLLVLAVVFVLGCSGPGEKGVNKGKDRPVPAGQTDPKK